MRAATRGAAHLLVHAERGGHRPLVLEGMEAARATCARRCWASSGARSSAQALYDSQSLKVGMVGRSRAQLSALAQTSAGAARREHPLVAAGAEVIGAHRGDGLVDRADAVHAVDHQQHVGMRCALSAAAISRIGRRMPVLECTQVRPTTRVFGADALQQAVDQAVGAGAARRRRTSAILRMLAPLRSAGQADRFVVRVVVVHRGQHFVAGLERQAVVDQGQAFGGAAR